MTKYKKSNEDYLSDEIRKYQNKTLLNSNGERCRIVDFSIYKGDKMVKLILSKGFGASEIKENISVPYHDLTIKLSSFSDAPKIDNSDLIKTKDIILNFKQSNKPLAMSEQTEDNLSGLRKHLFSAIRKLEGGTMKNEEAKAMAQVAQVIINSAKLEMEFKQLTNDKPDIKMIN